VSVLTYQWLNIHFINSQFENLDVTVRTVLKLILNRVGEGVDWIRLGHWWTLVNLIMNLRVP